MSKGNFKFFFDLGTSKVRAAAIDKEESSNNLYFEGSFFNEENEFGNKLNNLISDIEKKTGNFLKSADVMFDDIGALSISICLKKKIDNRIISNEELKFVINEAKQELISNYKDYEISHLILRNFLIQNKEYDHIPQIKINQFVVELIFIFFPIKKKMK